MFCRRHGAGLDWRNARPLPFLHSLAPFVTALIASLLAAYAAQPSILSLLARALLVVFTGSLAIVGCFHTDGIARVFWIGVAVPLAFSVMHVVGSFYHLLLSCNTAQVTQPQLWGWLLARSPLSPPFYVWHLLTACRAHWHIGCCSRRNARTAARSLAPRSSRWQCFPCYWAPRSSSACCMGSAAKVTGAIDRSRTACTKDRTPINPCPRVSQRHGFSPLPFLPSA